VATVLESTCNNRKEEDNSVHLFKKPVNIVREENIIEIVSTRKLMVHVCDPDFFSASRLLMLYLNEFRCKS
jgi:hypothetical protein